MTIKEAKLDLLNTLTPQFGEGEAEGLRQPGVLQHRIGAGDPSQAFAEHGFEFEAGESIAGKGAEEKVVRARINALVDYIETIQEK